MSTHRTTEHLAARGTHRLLLVLLLVPLMACAAPGAAQPEQPAPRLGLPTPSMRSPRSPLSPQEQVEVIPAPAFCASARADQIGIVGNAFPWEGNWNAFGKLLECSGARWARLELRWEYIQPRRGVWDYGDYDRLVEGYAAHGFQQLGLLAYSVAWASGGTGNDPVFGPPSDLDAWEAFVRSTVGRYKNQIRAWEIWNEPDVSFFWNGQDGGDPQHYLLLLERAYRAVKAVDPEAIVMNGGVTGTERGAVFLSTLLDLGGGAVLDAIALHPYLPNDGVENADYRDLVWPLIRAVGERAGKPLWLTEFGWSVSPGENAAAGSEAAQARYLARHLPLVFTLGDVRHAFVFVFKDPNNQPNFFGLTRIDATARPAYIAISVMAERLAGLTFEGPVDLDVAGVTQLRFSAPDRTVDILWAIQGEQLVRLPAERPAARVWRLEGHQETPTAIDGAISVIVGADPVLVEHVSQPAP